MDILPVHFKVLWMCGVWKERKDDNIVIAFLHFCYKYAVLILIYEFTLFEVVQLIHKRNRIHELTEALFLAGTYLTLCMKYANFLLRKKELLILLNYLRAKICQPRSPVEKLIIEEYDRKAKWSALSFLMISHATGLGFMIAPILGLSKGRWDLPTKTYVPYSITKLFPYVATYLQQSAALFYAVMLNVSFDALIYGFTIHACGQIELICRRLKEYFRVSGTSREESDTRESIEECVRHHVLVQIFVKKVEALFVWTVTILFFFSLIILCTSIFLISKTELFTVEFFSLCSYLASMLLQVFFYCWYGNELELKSKDIANAIFSSNWTTATPKERKSLLFLMLVSQKGLVLSYRGICTLSLKTFTWIFKTSYSAYNLLQQASN